MFSNNGLFEVLNTCDGRSKYVYKTKMNEKYESGDIIKIRLNLSDYSLLFLKNNMLCYTIDNINKYPNYPFYLPNNTNYGLCIMSYGFENTQILEEIVYYSNHTIIHVLLLFFFLFFFCFFFCKSFCETACFFFSAKL